jgi:hypothetical protein
MSLASRTFTLVALAAGFLMCTPTVAESQQPKGKDSKTTAPGDKKPDGKTEEKPKSVDETNIRLDWRTLTAALRHSNNNGFVMTCKEAGMTSFNVNVVSGSGESTTTTVKCGEGPGENMVLELPGKGKKGPYTITATAPGKPKVRSEKIKNVKGGDWVTLRIYLLGCDDVCEDH